MATPTENIMPPLHAIWITWEIQVRNRSMAKALDIPLYELLVERSRWIKYPILIAKTLQLIYRKKPALVFVQNPSIVLSFFAILIKIVARIPVIVDAHNAGLYPLDGKFAPLNLIARFIARRASLTLVSNAILAQQIRVWGGEAYVMPDPIPSLSARSQNANDKINKAHTRPYFFFICTWASDEPYWEVIEAAKKITIPVDIYISGNFRKKITEAQLADVPANVKLLGFIDEDVYVDYLAGAMASIDLTTRDHCLVCGGYESAALSVPCIVSDSAVSRDIFCEGFIYTDNHAEAIARAIEQAFNEREILTAKIQSMRKRHEDLCLQATRALCERARELRRT